MTMLRVLQEIRETAARTQRRYGLSWLIRDGDVADETSALQTLEAVKLYERFLAANPGQRFTTPVNAGSPR